MSSNEVLDATYRSLLSVRNTVPFSTEVTLHKLHCMYKDITGKDVPIKSNGSTTLEEFLGKKPELFTLVRRGAHVLVYAKPPVGASKLVDLVKRQDKPKKKKRARSNSQVCYSRVPLAPINSQRIPVTPLFAPVQPVMAPVVKTSTSSPLTSATISTIRGLVLNCLQQKTGYSLLALRRSEMKMSTFPSEVIMRVIDDLCTRREVQWNLLQPPQKVLTSFAFDSDPPLPKPSTTSGLAFLDHVETGPDQKVFIWFSFVASNSKDEILNSWIHLPLVQKMQFLAPCAIQNGPYGRWRRGQMIQITERSVKCVWLDGAEDPTVTVEVTLPTDRLRQVSTEWSGKPMTRTSAFIRGSATAETVSTWLGKLVFIGMTPENSAIVLDENCLKLLC